MYCKKCGKEIQDGAAFCKFCGGRIKEEGSAGTGSGAFTPMQPLPVAPLPGMPQNEPQKRKKAAPVSVPNFGLILTAVIVVVIAAGLLIVGLWSRNHKELRQARAYLEEGNYEEALECCETALAKDARNAKAYLMRADIHTGMEAYKDALADLDEYLETASEKELKKYTKKFEEKRKEIYNAHAEGSLAHVDEYIAADAYSDALAEVNSYLKSADEEELEEFQETFEKKREEVYRAQGEALAGVWKLEYDFANLIPDRISGNYKITTPFEPAPILLEFDGDGGMNLSIEPEYFDRMREILGEMATVLGTIYTHTQIGGKAAGDLTDYLTGILADNAAVSYRYEVAEDKLYCISGDDSEEYYCFEMNGDTLTLLSCSEEKFYLDFPLVLERVE